MDRKKLNKIKKELLQARRGSRKAADLQSLARQLGRQGAGKRGKEPMWESKEFPSLFVLSIPKHGGRDIPLGTKNSILDQLEDDVLEWENRLDELENDEGEEELE